MSTSDHISSSSIYNLIDRLYPINRSITGNGVRETLKIISEFIPIEIIEVPTGTEVFDWKIPSEWNIDEAWIKNPEGDKIIDFRNSNLHVLNYSRPVHEVLKLEELKNNIFSIPELPDWIPYRTSYHDLNWGFCMSHNQLMKLKEGNYEVKINSSLTEGSLTYGEFFVRGEVREEVLISVHICHPSLANDNLSGISIATHLAKWLEKSNPYFSYRFLFVPGTIGSITWLSLNEENLNFIRHGLVLTLLGDNSNFHYKKSRDGNNEIDRIVEYLFSNRYNNCSILDFSPYGYDERQYCSPGLNLPVGRISRAVHGEFDEYHTSADNMDFISEEKLNESFILLKDIINIIENNRTYISLNQKGEPQLGKRGFFAPIGGEKHKKDFHMALLWVLNLSDGNHSLLDIVNKSKMDFDSIHKAAVLLKSNSLLKIENE